MTVAITAEELAEAKRRAQAFAQWVVEARLRARGREPMAPPHVFRNHLLGVLSECAVAKAYGVPWEMRFVTAGWSTPDVGPWWVRGTDRENGSLIYTTYDKALDEPWILVYLPGFPESQEAILRGWCWGREAKEERFWRADIRDPAWLVPWRQLRTLDDAEAPMSVAA